MAERWIVEGWTLTEPLPVEPAHDWYIDGPQGELVQLDDDGRLYLSRSVLDYYGETALTDEVWAPLEVLAEALRLSGYTVTKT